MSLKAKKARGEGALGLIVGLALLIAVSVVLFKIVPLHIHGNEMYDIMQEQANFASMKPLDKIQWEIFRKGEEVLPPNALPLSEIKVVHKGQAVYVSAKYKEEVDVFGYHYVYNFDRSVEKPTF